MSPEAIEMTPEERTRLKAIMDHPDFSLLLMAISAKEAELRYLAGEAISESMVLGGEAQRSLPVDVQGKAISMLRWKAAREVLGEVAHQKFWPTKGLKITMQS